MVTFETNTVEFLNSLQLPDAQLNKLIELIEWEKELSWSNGYADCADQEDYV
jgi:hypothetical protein